MPQQNYQQYLGDGVYVSFDGYHIWLAANHHTNRVVALDDTVMLELINYYNTIRHLEDHKLDQ